MPAFFRTPAQFGAWLAQHAATESELLVGFYKRNSGRPSMTWPESVDEALCVGWIDGIRRRLDEHSYTIRFTPRKPTSNWSAINIARIAVLRAAGRMKDAGLEAYSRRRDATSGIYAYEQRHTAALDAVEEARFRRSKTAWRFFQAQPPSYRHLVIWRIVSAKRTVTRQARLTALIRASKDRKRL